MGEPEDRMSRLLYTLEDYFSAVAELRRGKVSGVVSFAVSSLCAFSGDVLRG